MTIERFSKDHEWVRVEDGIGTVGITEHAQTQLGDVVYVELPQRGARVGAGEAVAVVESVKAASDVFAPVSGEVTDVNDDLAREPALVNQDAEGRAWFFKLRIADEAELGHLMERPAYEAYVEESS